MTCGGAVDGEASRRPLPSSVLADGGLPQAGMLSLFYDDEAMVWGDEPDDREHWRLLWTPADQALVRHERPVAMTDHEEAIFPPVALAVREELTFPAWATRECEALTLDERDADAYVDIMERGADRCRLLGYADAVQGGIAELATEATGRPAADVHSWRLLLQISSEDAAQMMWGDVGFLYVVMPEDAMRAHRWEDAWLVMECS